jgi:hypothetical protein
VEETAIKERAFEVGWDFLIVVALSSAGAPAWLPKTKIWLGTERFGLQGAAGVIDARVQETGGESRKETARQRAERLARSNRLRKEREDWLSSREAVASATEELGILFTYLETEVAAIKGLPDTPPIEFQKRPGDTVCVVRTPFASFVLGWSQQYSNSLRYSTLVLREFDGTYFFESEGGRRGEPVTIRSENHFMFTLDEAGIKGWQAEEPNARFFSSSEFADDLLSRLLDRVAEIQAQPTDW